jgi:hypothetical protein
MKLHKETLALKKSKIEESAELVYDTIVPGLGMESCELVNGDYTLFSIRWFYQYCFLIDQ